MISKFRGAIFDLDGTLLDTLGDLADSANEMLAAMGLPVHPTDAYRHFVGDGVHTLIERIVPADTPEEQRAACLERYREAYSRRWNATTRPYAGIPELLDGLVQRGLHLAVLSNKPDHFTRQCVNEFLPAYSWSMILGMRDGFPRKPDPAGVHEILRELRLAPEECLYLGDTNTDMQTAVSAGVFPVGVLWGFRDREELRQNGAEFVIEHPRQLLQWMEEQSPPETA